MAIKKKKAVKRAARRKAAPAGGRRSRYRGVVDDQTAQVAAELGATNEQIAAALNISVHTLGKWLPQNPTLRAAVDAGRQAFTVGKVKDSLHRRAVGYEYDEVTQELRECVEEGPAGPVTTLKMIEVRRVRRHEPANPTCIIFELCNKLGTEYSQRQEHRVTVALPTLVIEKRYEKPAEKPS